MAEPCHRHRPSWRRFATPAQRARFEIGRFGVHWEELDEDIQPTGLALGAKAPGAKPPVEA